MQLYCIYLHIHIYSFKSVDVCICANLHFYNTEGLEHILNWWSCYTGQRTAPVPPKGDFKAWICGYVFGLQGAMLSLTTPAVSAISTAPKQNIINIYLESTSEGPANICFQYAAALLKRGCCNVILDPFWILYSFNLNHVQLVHREKLRVCRVLVSLNTMTM